MINSLKDIKGHKIQLFASKELMPTLRLLIVDDEIDSLSPLQDVLSEWGYEVVCCTTARDALDELRRKDFDILMADLIMPEVGGIGLIKEAQKINENLVCIIMTGYGTIQTTVEAMKAGAFDYILKPYDLKILRTVLSRAIDVSQLRKSQAIYRSIVDDYQTEMICRFLPDGMLTFVNKPYCRYFEKTKDELLGKSFMRHIVKEDVKKIKQLFSMLNHENFMISLEHRVIRQNKEIYWQKWMYRGIFHKDGYVTEIQAIGSDITKWKKAEDRVEYLASYDVLTDLPNRNLFLDRVNQELKRTESVSKLVATTIVDINRFKSINDIYGSEFGDKILREVAKRLSNSTRKGDIIARLGNDEFGIALLNITDSEEIKKVLEKIIKDISNPLKVDREEISLTISTGISVFPYDGSDAHELLKFAGLALTKAKEAGRKTYQFYSKDMNVKTTEFLTMEKHLLNALKKEEFILHYQPYWDINTKKIVGMEALVRWERKDKGLVPPGKFIPILEETGLIIEVGEWILREAIRQVKEWQDNKYSIVPVSVNLSLIQFRQKNLAEMVKKIIGEYGFYPSLLTLEITESAFMQDLEFTNTILKTLKDIGCSVSIDDFGTGYSSLAYLKRFPIDNLKIDISFIREITVEPDTASIVTAIINMAHALNLETIAEGIETEEQWKFLRLLKCDMGQGYYLSKPLPAEEMEKLFIDDINGK